MRRGRGLILAYHNILPRGAEAGGDRSLHLAADVFARQLDLLARTHEIRPLDDLVRGESPSRRPLAAVTFDDAYHGAVTTGVAELVKRRMPATIFVAPGMLGQPSFWWDAVVSPASGGLPDEVREEALTTYRGMEEEVRGWVREAGLGLRPVGDDARPATEDELARAARLPGITVASHSWSHPNLTQLTTTRLEEELVRPIEWLRERFDCFRPWLAYPYGICSMQVEETAAAMGYQIAVRVEGGWIGKRSNRLLSMPRLNVPAGVSQAGFELRAAGFLCR